MSNKVTGYIIAFSAGAAIGSFAAWRALKVKYEAIAREEIASVKEVFANRQSEHRYYGNQDKGQEAACTSNNAYADVLQKEGYINYSEIKKDEVAVPEVSMEPYVIAPEDFDTEDGYETINLTYYADGVIADDCDELLENADDVVGPDIASHFGEYEDDAVYVRNNERKTDYEILRDRRSYAAVTGRDPYNSEEE